MTQRFFVTSNLGTTSLYLIKCLTEGLRRYTLQKDWIRKKLQYITGKYPLYIGSLQNTLDMSFRKQIRKVSVDLPMGGSITRGLQVDPATSVKEQGCRNPGFPGNTILKEALFQT